MVRPTVRPERRATILMIAGDAGFENAAEPLLVAAGYNAVRAHPWEAAWLTLTRTQPDAALCDHSADVVRSMELEAAAAVRGLPRVLADHASKLESTLLVARTQGHVVSGVAFPLDAAALRAALEELLHPVPSTPLVGAPVAADEEPGAIRRRHTLAETLDEIEQGVLLGVGVIVVSRAWWDALPLAEQTRFRRRCDRLAVALRADHRLSRHFVELGRDPVAPRMSSEQEV